MDLICLGDVMVDVHVAGGALAPGGDVHGTVRVVPGGTSANAAVWAAWAGTDAGVIAAVGDDLAGRLVIDALRERGVDVTGIARVAAPTGTMLVVTQGSERSMVADRGANALLAPDDLPSALDAEAVLVSGYLLLQATTTETAEAVLDRGNTFLAIEAASWPLIEHFGTERFFDSTKRADVVLANADEARALTGESGDAAVVALGERYRIAVVKQGRDGIRLSDDGQISAHGVNPVPDVDPTGAGDAFDGVFLGLLARGVHVSTAADRACAAGAQVASSRELWPTEPSA
jgi:sugar/nucleoside kinase (ribokinase family)